ncbi:MAG: GAF domain-containing protein [Oscillospiraceae bacterium]|jgi:GAF domain-containing protein|nr:GAF domain-containing protein [Oscillospiraceae bacterium]
MFTLRENLSPTESRAALVSAAEALLDGETDLIAGLANVSAAMGAYLDDVNWAGFYLRRGEELVLGPFQGLPACARIAWGRGVCGSAAAAGETRVVPDVTAFPGHIACDAASRSEVVVPLIVGGAVRGVLDVDSPTPGRFGAADADCLERVGGLVARWMEGV